jgi:hypothetical protein
MHLRLRITAMVLAGTALALPAPAWTQTRSLDAQIEPVRVKYGMRALAAAVVKKGEERRHRCSRWARLRHQHTGDAAFSLDTQQ